MLEYPNRCYIFPFRIELYLHELFMPKKISIKEINRLAIPAMLAGVVEPLISLTDTAVAGRLPNHPEEAIAAIGLVGSFLSALIWIFAQSSNALSAIIAQAVGKKQVKRTRSLVAQIFFFNLMIGVLLSFVVYLFRFEIIQLYGAKQHLLNVTLDYLNIRLWGFPLSLLTLTLFGVFRGFQNTSWAMQISFLGGLVNVILDLFFVYVLDWNIKGIAYASVIAQSVMLITALIFLFIKTPFRLSILWPLHANFKKTLVMSFDLLLRAISLNIGLFLAFRLATQLGDGTENQFVAAHAILIQIWLFSAFLIDGYSNAGNALAGKLIGSNDIKGLKLLIKDLLKIMVSLGIAITTFYFIFYYPIGRLLTHSESVLAVFYSVFWIVALMQPVNAVSFLWDGIYKGLGLTSVLRNVFVGVLLFVFIPSLYLFREMNLGLEGIWFAFFLWMIGRSIGLIYDFSRRFGFHLNKN